MGGSAERCKPKIAAREGIMTASRRMAKLSDIRRVLGAHGTVRFAWGHGGPVLLDSANSAETEIDGRSYDAFLATADQKYSRVETGSSDAGDLIIEWALKTGKTVLTTQIQFAMLK